MTRTDADRLAFLAAGWGAYSFYFDGDNLWCGISPEPRLTISDLMSTERRAAVDRAMSGEDGPYEKRTATK